MDAKRLIPVIVIAGGVAVLARKLAQGHSSMDWGQMIERMPDDAPPKWMFNNITALRDENRRILWQTDEILAGLRRLGDEHAELIAAGGGGNGGGD